MNKGVSTWRNRRRRSPKDWGRQTPGSIQWQLDEIRTQTDLETLKAIIDTTNQTPDVKKAAQARYSELLAPQGFADSVNGHLANSADEVIAAGRVLIEAKRLLLHRQWQKMFKDDSDAVARPIRVSMRTVQMLMKIARHPVLSDAKHVSFLPPHWSTLHKLAQLKPTILENALVEGRIHPEMQRKDVARLVAPHVVDNDVTEQLEALARQVSTADDPVVKKYAQDALAEQSEARWEKRWEARLQRARRRWNLKKMLRIIDHAVNEVQREWNESDPPIEDRARIAARLAEHTETWTAEVRLEGCGTLRKMDEL